MKNPTIQAAATAAAEDYNRSHRWSVAAARALALAVLTDANDHRVAEALAAAAEERDREDAIVAAHLAAGIYRAESGWHVEGVGIVDAVTPAEAAYAGALAVIDTDRARARALEDAGDAIVAILAAAKKPSS